jgi:hypothetical protein
MGYSFIGFKSMAQRMDLLTKALADHFQEVGGAAFDPYNPTPWMSKVFENRRNREHSRYSEIR